MGRDGYLPPGCTQDECDRAQPGYWDEPEDDEEEPENERDNRMTKIVKPVRGSDLTYHVDLDPAGNHLVKVEKTRRQLPHGYGWSTPTYFQTIKPNSQNWKRAVRAAENS